MVDTLPKLPEGVTRKDLEGVHIMAMEHTDGTGLQGGVNDFDAPSIGAYNVWVGRDGYSFVRELDRTFLVSDHESREHALAKARKYAWLLAAKYQLELEEY